MYSKIALGNVKKSLGDYSIFFATLAFASCLLYSFTASGDYLLAMDLTEQQRGAYGSASMVTQAFSVFSVVVFAFLVVYANRFILRRRAKEFGLYGLLGMGPFQCARILAWEGALVGIVSLVLGLLLGVALSPAFGVVAAFVFGVPWHLVFSLSADAAVWTVGCFAVIMGLSTLLGIRDLNRRSLADLLRAGSAPESPRCSSRFPRWLQLLLALGILAAVWGTCLFNPISFVVWILPMGIAAVLATAMLFRWAALTWPERARRHPDRYLRGLRCFTVRQVESRVSLSANAMACTCVLLAVGTCMMVAGFAFSVGMRGPDGPEGALNLAPFGYVGIFYGITFLVAAAAVLALQQLADAADGAGRFRVLHQLGCDGPMMRNAVRSQVGVYFAAPLAFGLVHDVFGLALVGFLALTLGSSGYFAIIAAVIGLTVALLGAYYLLTCRECERLLLRP